MRKVIGVFALLSVVALAPAARATTFSINLAIGAGTASGTITTDNTIGFLTSSNITDWNISLNPNPGTAFTLLGPLSGNNSGLQISGNGLFTTPSGLYFDFANSAYALFQNPNPGSGMNYLCFAGSGVLCGFYDGPAINMGTDIYGANTAPQDAGRVLISGEGSAVPEPGTMGLLGLSMVGLGVLRRFRRK